MLSSLVLVPIATQRSAYLQLEVLPDYTAW